jgi:hypothetical protein
VARPRLAVLLLLALPATALPPLSPGFVRLDELRIEVDQKKRDLLEQEAFAKKPREERMLLTFRKQGDFEGKPLTSKAVVQACLEWEEIRTDNPTAAGQRVVELLPVVLRERCGPAERRERRIVSRILLDALDDDYLPVRTAAIASLRAIYPFPREDRYDPKMGRRERISPIRAWKRHVSDQNR